MPTRRKALVLSLGLGLAVGGAYPFIDLMLACRAPSSEACVWGKAYLPLTLGLSLVLLGTATAGLAYACFAWLRKR